MPFFTIDTHKSVDLASSKVRILNTQDDDGVSTGVYTVDTVKETTGAIPPSRNVELAKLDLSKIPTGALLAIVSYHIGTKKDATSHERIAAMQITDTLEDFSDNAQKADATQAEVDAAKKLEALVAQNP